MVAAELASELASSGESTGAKKETADAIIGVLSNVLTGSELDPVHVQQVLKSVLVILLP